MANISNLLFISSLIVISLICSQAPRYGLTPVACTTFQCFLTAHRPTSIKRCDPHCPEFLPVLVSAGRPIRRHRRALRVANAAASIAPSTHVRGTKDTNVDCRPGTSVACAIFAASTNTIWSSTLIVCTSENAWTKRRKEEQSAMMRMGNRLNVVHVYIYVMIRQ